MLLHLLIYLISAHMLADYLFQWQAIVEKKKEGKIWALIFHVVCFYILAIILTINWLSWMWLIVLSILTVLHAIQDRIKISLQKKRIDKLFQIELVDLIVHLAIIIIITVLFFPKFQQSSFVTWINKILTAKLTVKIFLYVSSFSFVIRGGTALVRSLLDQIGKTPPKQSKMIGFLAKDKSDNENQTGENEYNIGKIIGNLERILLLIFVILGNYAAIGFVIAAKSVARFKNLEDHNFAEYYLVGTLTSSLIAIGTGLVVVYISGLI